MRGPVFDSIENAAAYLMLEDFPLSHEVQHFNGKKVIVLLMLSKLESERYTRVKRDGGRAITGAIWVTGLKSIARPFAKAVVAAHKLDPFGAFESARSVFGAMDDPKNRKIVDEKIARDDDARVCHLIGEAFTWRQNESYYTIKSEIHHTQTGPVCRLEGNFEGMRVFMLRLSQ